VEAHALGVVGRELVIEQIEQYVCRRAFPGARHGRGPAAVEGMIEEARVNGLTETIEARWQQIAARWPGVVVSRSRFEAHLAQFPVEEPRFTGELHLDDLYLAVACADGDQAALRAFESTMMAQTVPSIRALDSEAAFVDEVQQRVRTRLLVGEAGRPPRIAEYRGRGPLAAWVTVTAVRTGLTFMRESKRAGRFGDERWAEAIVLPQTGDPELDHLKARYRVELEQAVAHACAALEDRERAVLRMYFIDGLNIDKIGRVYGVHRSTVARWIARTRDQLNAATRQHLIDDLALPDDEVASIDRLVRSQLDISLDGLLR
jgi:RNA polymerase sigma-70 factor (ECF subfamily)